MYAVKCLKASVNEELYVSYNFIWLAPDLFHFGLRTRWQFMTVNDIDQCEQILRVTDMLLGVLAHSDHDGYNKEALAFDE